MLSLAAADRSWDRITVFSITPMLLFAQNLTVAGTLYHFIFREIISTESEKFFVTVQNDEGPVTSFEMKRVHGHWLMMSPYPEWVKPLEHELDRFIREQMERK